MTLEAFLVVPRKLKYLKLKVTKDEEVQANVELILRCRLFICFEVPTAVDTGKLKGQIGDERNERD